MAGPGVPRTQINLHHSIGASAVLTRRMAMVWRGIAPIQEPWVYSEKIRGLGGCGTIFKGPLENVPRECIAVKDIDALLVPNRCSRGEKCGAKKCLRF